MGKGPKGVVAATAKDKGKAIGAAEKKAQSEEKARLVAERNLAEAKDKLRAMELKLARQPA